MTDLAVDNADPRPSDRRGIVGWIMFDWATQPFFTLIITFVFAPYFASHVAETAVQGQEIWGYAAGLGGFAVALTAPVFGAIADRSGPRKPWIAFFLIFAVIGCWMFWFAAPGSEHVTIAVIALVVALFGFESATVFNNSMMPVLVPRARLGRLSGNGWSIGYVGGIVSLVIVLGFLAANPTTGKTLIGLSPLFGLDPATHEGDRISGPLSAVWYAIFVLPMFLFTRDAPNRAVPAGVIATGLKELGQTLKKLPSQRSYFSFLLSSMFYRDALNGLYAFGGIYAAGVLGWNTIQIGVFGVLAAATGVIGAWAGGQIDDRHGPKVVVTVSIITLTLCCFLVLSTSPTQVLFVSVGSEAAPSGLPDLAFYIAGCLIGAAGGALQAASRTLLVDQVQERNIIEAFGLYALSGKATTFLAPLLVALATGLFDSQRIGVTPIIVLFLIGIVLLSFVKSAHDSPARR